MNKNIRKLNTMRGIAALMVLVSHYSNQTLIINNLFGDGVGQYGVMFFFLLSAFLMGYLYIEKDFDHTNSRNYAIARFARVVPLYLLVVFISFFTQLLALNNIFYPILTSRGLLLHLSFIFGASVLWTIPVEVQFYGLFPLFWWINKKKGSTYLSSVLIFSLMVLFLIGLRKYRFDIAGFDGEIILSLVLPVFLIGLLFGILYTQWQPLEKNQSNWYLSAFLLLPLLFPNIYHPITAAFFGSVRRWEAVSLIWADVGVLLIVSVIFFAYVFFVPDDNPLISNPVGDFLGDISYSLYLWHLPILIFITSNFNIGNPYLWGIGYTATTIVISYLSFRVIELPAKRFLRQRLMVTNEAHNAD